MKDSLKHAIKLSALLATSVAFAAFSNLIQQSGQPHLSTRSTMFGGAAKEISAERHSAVFAMISIGFLVCAILQGLKMRKYVRGQQRVRRSASVECIYCGFSRSGIPESTACPECGRKRP